MQPGNKCTVTVRFYWLGLLLQIDDYNKMSLVNLATEKYDNCQLLSSQATLKSFKQAHNSPGTFNKLLLTN